MHSTLIDSRFLGSLFSTPEMKHVFSDSSTLARYTETEVALALAEGKLGLIPTDAAKTIAERAPKIALDMDRLERETHNVGYPILPLVHQLSKMCGPEGEYLHWGATTQDIMDTATVLQVRAALNIIETDLNELDQILDALAAQYRDAPMAGRTHLQHALPITFGYKVAVWLLMIRRHRERLLQLKPRVLVGQFGGAAGTLASLGSQGLAVHAALMTELQLEAAPVTWHVARDGLTETIQFLALVTGSLGKIALDIMLMMTNELGEAFEPFVKGRGASSTMPQKRNPISCELMLSASKAVRQHAGLALDAMVQDFERATGPWHIEWAAIPESFILTAGALHQAKFMLSGLEVDTARMLKNLDLSGGLIVAEAVMMGLAPFIGRQTAHDVVYDACRVAATKGLKLAEVLYSDEKIAGKLDRATIDRLCDPANYLGAAPEMVDRMRAWRN